MSESARKNSRETMRELREQRVRVAEWYGSLRTSSADAWEKMKQGFLDAYASLRKAWEKSEQEFEKDES